MAKPRILLADDDQLLLGAFRKLLETEFEIIGTVADARALRTLAVQLKPDAVVVDLDLPLLSGSDAGRELKKLVPGTKFFVVTSNKEPNIAVATIREWASGYLLKKYAGSELVNALWEVLNGRSYITPTLAQQLVNEFIREPSDHGHKSLTPRQREVLQLLAEGRTMKETATILKLSARTVAFHKYRIMQEFGLNNNSDLLKLAIREHLVSPV